MEVYNKRKTPIMRWLIAFILLLLFGAVLFMIKDGYAPYLVDDPVCKFLFSMRAAWLTGFFKGVTFIANPKTLTVLCLILLVFPKTTLRFGIPVSIVTGLGTLAHNGLKDLIMRDRPDEALWLIKAGGYSFPSGHANASLLFFLFLAFLLARVLKRNKHDDISHLMYIVFIIIIFLIGVSRVYLGVHYPTDIIGGWCLGGVLLVLFISLYDALYPLKYHLGIQVSEWSSDGITAWNRPDKTK